MMIREHDLLVGAENSAPKPRKREYFYMLVAVALVLAGPLRVDLESAEITERHVAEMPAPERCEATIGVYEAGEYWTRLRAHPECSSALTMQAPVQGAR